MPRPHTRRQVCFLPQFRQFSPEDNDQNKDSIVSITVDELEVIRLIDYENKDQNEAAEAMGVSRGTVQRLYQEARHKIAEFLICGKTLKINEGLIKLCDHPEHQHRKRCNCKNC